MPNECIVHFSSSLCPADTFIHARLHRETRKCYKMLQENMVSQTLLIMRTYKGRHENVTKCCKKMRTECCFLNFSIQKIREKGSLNFCIAICNILVSLLQHFQCLLMSPRMNRSVCEFISKHYIV